MHTFSQIPLATESIVRCHQDERISDSIHSEIHIPREVKSLLHSLPVARMRNLKQLGACCYTSKFSAGTHSRYEHSLGVASLSNQFVRHLFANLKVPESIVEQRVLQVTAAGLAHDLGHGPFSHLWEVFMRGRGVIDWHHEDMSEQLVDLAVDSMGTDYDGDSSFFYDTENVAYIKKCIRGRTPTDTCDDDYPWTLDIVANNVSGLDTDKLDYIMRDAHHVGMKHAVNVDANFITKHACVHNDQIVYEETTGVYSRLNAVFSGRANMHAHVYQSPQVHAAELVILDILNLLDETKKYSDKTSPAEYLKLDDTILGSLMREDPEQSDVPSRVREAQIMLKNLYLNKTYHLAADLAIPPDCPFNKHTAQEMLERDLPNTVGVVTAKDGTTVDLQVGDIKVKVSDIHKGWGEQNPMDFIRFYSWTEEYGGRQVMKSAPWPADEYVSMHTPAHGGQPTNHQKFFVRVFLKPRFSKMGLEDKILEALKRLLGHHFTQESGHSPSRNGGTRKRSRGFISTNGVLLDALPSQEIEAEDLNSSDEEAQL